MRTSARGHQDQPDMGPISLSTKSSLLNNNKKINKILNQKFKFVIIVPINKEETLFPAERSLASRDTVLAFQFMKPELILRNQLTPSQTTNCLSQTCLLFVYLDYGPCQSSTTQNVKTAAKNLLKKYQKNSSGK